MLRLLSCNINGLRSRKRIDAVFTSFNHDVLCLQETWWDAEVVQRIERLWPGPVFYSLGTPRSCGVAVLFRPGVVANIRCVHRDAAGRVLVLDFLLGGVEYRLGCVYAPCGGVERKNFFQELAGWCSASSLWIGDFNTVLSGLDQGRRGRLADDAGRSALYKLMRQADLIDTWRISNPHSRTYSWRRVVRPVLQQSRIDLCLAAGGVVKCVDKCEYILNSFSDHSHLSLTLGHRCSRRGGGVWCFNSSLLNDASFTRALVKMVSGLSAELFLADDVLTWWVGVKRRLKSLSLKFGRRRGASVRGSETALRAELAVELHRVAEDPTRDHAQSISLTNQLVEFARVRCRGAAVRSRARSLIEGEAGTAYHLSFEKAKQDKSYIDELIDSTGTVVSGAREVVRVARDHYACAFALDSEVAIHSNALYSIVDVRLSEEDRAACDAPFTLQEVEAAIGSLGLNKSPGLDGLSGELYRSCGGRLAPVLLCVFEEAQRRGELPGALAEGVISLIFKGSGDRRDLANYRPLTVLGSDYKVLAKVLANRLREAAPTIIGHSQSYGMKGRDIADNILSTRCAIGAMADGGGVMLSVDLQKAFDRVDHGYLFGLLRQFGFGECFVNWIELLYRDAASRIKLNGVVSEAFLLERSVRQGCPLSSLLFSIAIEPLALLLLRDGGITGIPTPLGREIKVSLYADDVTITVRTETDLERAMHHLRVFERASGARVNMAKSTLTHFGAVSRSLRRWSFQQGDGTVRVLGVYLGADIRAARDKSWAEIVGKVRRRLTLWAMRSLSLRARVQVINSLVLPMVLHTLAVHDLPAQTLQMILTAIRAFVWRGRPSLIAYATLVCRVREGGLNLRDLGTVRCALRVKLVQKLLSGGGLAYWLDFLQEQVGRCGPCGLFNLCGVPTVEQVETLDPLFAEVMRVWGGARRLLGATIEHRDQVLLQPLLRNPCLAPAGRPLVTTLLSRAGLHQVHHLVGSEGRVDRERVIRALRTNAVTFSPKVVVALCARVESALPDSWGAVLRRQPKMGHGGAGDPGGTLPDFHVSWGGPPTALQAMTTKKWYRLLVDKACRRPTAEVAWGQLFPGRDAGSIWHNVDLRFAGPDIFGTEYRIRHRRIFTAVILRQIDKDRYKRTCVRCEKEDETLEHLVLSCSSLVPFWVAVCGLLARCCAWSAPTEQELYWTLIFGLPENSKTSDIWTTNLVLAVARHAIVVARNCALYDNKKVNTWQFFKNWLRRHLRALWTVRPAWIENCSCSRATLCSMVGGQLMFNF